MQISTLNTTNKTNKNYNNICFKKFIKINGNPKALNNFRNELQDNHTETFTSFIVNKTNKDASLYLFSKKDLDKMIDLMNKKLSFINVRYNIEKFMKKAPTKLSLENAIEKLGKNNFKL